MHQRLGGQVGLGFLGEFAGDPGELLLVAEGLLDRRAQLENVALPGPGRVPCCERITHELGLLEVELENAQVPREQPRTRLGFRIEQSLAQGRAHRLDLLRSRPQIPLELDQRDQYRRLTRKAPGRLPQLFCPLLLAAIELRDGRLALEHEQLGGWQIGRASPREGDHESGERHGAAMAKHEPLLQRAW